MHRWLENRLLAWIESTTCWVHVTHSTVSLGKHITRVDKSSASTFRVELFGGRTRWRQHEGKTFPCDITNSPKKRKASLQHFFRKRDCYTVLHQHHRRRLVGFKRGNPQLPHQKFKHSAEFELHILQWDDLEFFPLALRRKKYFRHFESRRKIVVARTMTSGGSGAGWGPLHLVWWSYHRQLKIDAEESELCSNIDVHRFTVDNS